MEQINYSDIKDLKELRAKMQPWALSTEYNFSWLKSITDSSLDEYLMVFLKEYVPKFDRYVTLDLKEHVSEVNSLLGKCTELRRRIFELESVALTTAISYAETIHSMEPNELLSSLSVKANYALSGEGEGGGEGIEQYEQAQRQKNLVVKNMLYAKLNLHNQAGSSLNYGEVVDSLRKLYADNIKTVYERLFIIKRILKYSFGQDSAPLPNFYQVKDSLDDFIWWMRQELDHYEYAAQYDFEHVVVMKLSTPDEVLAFRNNGYCTFKVTDADLGSLDIDLGKYSPRVSGISVTLSAEDYAITTAKYGVANSDVYMDIRTNSSHKRTSYGIDWSLMTNNENRAYDYAIKANRETLAASSFFTVDISTPVAEVALDTAGLYSPMNAEEEDFEKGVEALANPALMPKKKIVDFKKGKFGELVPVYKAPEVTENIIKVPGKISYGPVNIGRRPGGMADGNKFNGAQVLNILPQGTWTLRFRNVSSDKTAREMGLSSAGNVELTIKLTYRKIN